MERPAHVRALMDALPGVWVAQDGSFRWKMVVWHCGDPEEEYRQHMLVGGPLVFVEDEATGSRPAFRLSQIKAIIAYVEAEVARARREGRISQ